MSGENHDKLNAYLDSGGAICPFCGEDGGLEGAHSFEYEDGEVSLLVACAKCGEQHIQIYEFRSWIQDEDVTSNSDRFICPSCGEKISEDEYFEIHNEDFEGLYGEIVCEECGENVRAVFELKGYD